MQGVRGGYTSMDELYALLHTRSLPMIFDRQLRRARGFRRTRSPRQGEIAMIKIGDRDVCGAIVTTGYVVLGQGMGLSRVSFDQARLVAAWTWGDLRILQALGRPTRVSDLTFGPGLARVLFPDA